MLKATPNCGICILAGGQSTRMGHDKARVRLGSRTLLGRVRQQAAKLGLPMRVVRRDLVPRCGPLGGIYTALRTSEAQAELFLACDMPYVSSNLLRKLLENWETQKRAAFISSNRVAGFPFLLPVKAIETVERHIQRNQFSLQKLALALKAKILHAPPDREWELLNVNTRADLQQAKAMEMP